MIDALFNYVVPIIGVAIGASIAVICLSIAAMILYACVLVIFDK